MSLSIVRSPAKVAWWLVCNGITIEVCQTKREAETLKKELEEKYA